MSEGIQEKLNALSAQLAEAEKDVPVLLTRQQSFQMLVRKHGAMVAQYQEAKLAAKLADLTGNKAVALQCLDSAANIFSQIKALRSVAASEGLGAEYDRVMEQLKEHQRNPPQSIEQPTTKPVRGAARAKRRRAAKEKKSK